MASFENTHKQAIGLHVYWIDFINLVNQREGVTPISISMQRMQKWIDGLAETVAIHDCNNIIYILT